MNTYRTDIKKVASSYVGVSLKDVENAPKFIIIIIFFFLFFFFVTLFSSRQFLRNWYNFNLIHR